MSDYAIVKVKGKLKIASYSYWRSSNSFLFLFGTSRIMYRYTDEMDFEIIADLIIDSVDVKYGKFLTTETYPKDTVLSVKMRNSHEVVTEECIRKLKGFKKFFGHMNIKTVELVK